MLFRNIISVGNLPLSDFSFIFWNGAKTIDSQSFPFFLFSPDFSSSGIPGNRRVSTVNENRLFRNSALYMLHLACYVKYLSLKGLRCTSFIWYFS